MFEFNGCMMLYPDKSLKRKKRKNDYKHQIKNEKRQEYKISDRYWRRKIDKSANKKSISKWTKRHLLSVNGY